MIHQSSIIDSKSNISKKVKIGQNRNIADPIIQKFELALKKLTLNLAKQVVVDGEGAKKFVTIKVISRYPFKDKFFLSFIDFESVSTFTFPSR